MQLKWLDAQSERDDRDNFRNQIRECLDDERVERYFRKDLVDPAAVIESLFDGEDSAFDQSRLTEAYMNYNPARDDQTIAINYFRIVTTKSLRLGTGLLALSLPIGIFLAASESFKADGVWRLLAILGSSSILACSGLLSASGQLLSRAASALLLSLGIALAVILYYFEIGPNLTSIIFFCILSFFAGWQLRGRSRIRDIGRVALLPLVVVGIAYFTFHEVKLRRQWLNDSKERVILPQVIPSINSILGESHSRLLVEQGSEGLKKLHDLKLTVSTFSEKRIRATLSRFDGASIALSGPRGVGKSTWLRVLSEPSSGSRQGDFSVYVSAPAEYVPRDFLIDLFQRLCEEYLSFRDYTYDGPLKGGLGSRARIRAAIRGISSTAFRSVLALALLSVIIWSFFTDAKSTISEVEHHHLQAWYHATSSWIHGWWLHHRTPTQLIGILLFLMIWPGRHHWRRLSRRSEPQWVVMARENLFRLQVERTVTSGLNAGLPGLRGVSLSINRGSSLKHAPWTFPELVSQIRRFIKEIAQEEKEQGRHVLISIDEIDRIGSIEQAERFISEIKAIFGVENCFFLVSVAEDVGSAFTRRAISERSVFENAFDDIVIIGPLTLNESRELLLLRVPGFTDAFVLLVHSLSGGIPRELIRMTRRLVELNEELRNNLDYPPLLEDLTKALVKEALIEAIIGSRNAISQLTLDQNWGPTFDQIRNLLTALRSESPVTVSESMPLMTRLADLQVDTLPAESDSVSEKDKRADSIETARRIMIELSTFVHFGLTIIAVFDSAFNLAEAKKDRRVSDIASYEQLAAARRELAVSPKSCRLTIDRFRTSRNI